MQQADPQLVAKAADFIRRREKSKAELVEELTLLHERVSVLEQAQAARDSGESTLGAGEKETPIDPGESKASLQENIRQLQQRNRELEQLTRGLEEKLESAREAAEPRQSQEEDGSAEAAEWRRRTDDLQQENDGVKKELAELQERNRELEQLTRELEEKLESANESAQRRESEEDNQSAEAAEWRRRSDDLQEESLRVKGQLDELQSAHDDLNDANRSLQRLVDGSPGLHWFLSPDLQTTAFNQTFLDLVGENPDDGEKKWQDYLHPEDLDDFTDTVRNAAEQGEPFSLEHRLRCGDGSYRWFWSVAAPCSEGVPTSPGSRGGESGYVGVSLDVTNQRAEVQRLAEDNRRRQDQLEQCWLSREKELTEIHAQIQEELAAPLTSAAEHLELMEKQMAELRRLWRNADEARTRLGTGQSPALLQQEGLEKAISELARHAATCRGLDVHCDAPGVIPRLSPESESLIFAVVRDLMRSLSAANGAGSLRVTLGTEEGQLRILLEGRKILLEETDPGAAVQHRLDALSGHLRIETVEEGDVQIELTVPASF